jgi:hypothetical protein
MKKMFVVTPKFVSKLLTYVVLKINESNPLIFI